MRRKLFTFTSLLSLVLFVVTLVLWVRSVFISDALCKYTRWGRRPPFTYRDYGVESHSGSIRLYYSRNITNDQHRNTRFYGMPDAGGTAYGARPLPRRSWRGTFSWSHDATSNDKDPTLPADQHFAAEVEVPYWFIVADWAMVPAIRIVTRLRLRPGFCNACGYDLTGNTSGVCPECGTAVAGKAEA